MYQLLAPTNKMLSQTLPPPQGQVLLHPLWQFQGNTGKIKHKDKEQLGGAMGVNSSWVAATRQGRRAVTPQDWPSYSQCIIQLTWEPHPLSHLPLGPGKLKILSRYQIHWGINSYCIHRHQCKVT